MRNFYTALLLVLSLCSLIACKEPIKTSLPLAPRSYLSAIPGALIYDLDSKDCSQAHAICFRYALKTGEREHINNKSIDAYRREYDSQNGYDVSPNKRYTIQWRKVTKKAGFSLQSLSGEVERPVIVDQKTGLYRPLNMDGARSIGGVSNFQWAPDSSHIIYSLIYEPDTTDADIEYLFVIQNTKTGIAYRLFKEPQPNILIMWQKD